MSQAAPKRLPYFLLADADLPAAVLRIFLDEVERFLCDHSSGSGFFAVHSGALPFIHRFGFSLNGYLYFLLR